MNPKSSAHFFALILAGFLAIAATVAQPRMAHAGEKFTPQKLKKAMLDLYCQFPDQPAEAGCKPGTPGAPVPPEQAPSGPADPTAVLDTRPVPQELTEAGKQIWSLTTADQKSWALLLFDKILELNPDQFNETIKDLSLDYYAFPEHRAAIELLLSMIDVRYSAGVKGFHDEGDNTGDTVRERLREELYAARRTQSNTIRVLDHAFSVFVFGSLMRGAGVGLYRGYKGFQVWRSGGVGLSTKKIIRGAFDSLKYSTEGTGIKATARALAGMQFKAALFALIKDKKLQLVAAGSTWGIVDIVMDSSRFYKVDPRHVLEPVQAQIIEDGGRDAAFMRDEVNAMNQESDQDLRLHVETYRKRLLEIDRAIVKHSQELGHLHQVVPNYRPQMEPIAQDLWETQQGVLGLRSRFKKFESEEILKRMLR